MMKKIVALLVAAILTVSCISVVSAAGTPAEEMAIYIALMNAGFSNPDLLTRHFDSIAALTPVELAAIDTYFASIDSAMGVAIQNVDLNLAGSQKITVFANLNAIAKICKLSYVILAQIPLTAKIYPIDADGKIIEEGSSEDPVSYRIVPETVTEYTLPIDFLVTTTIQSFFSTKIDEWYNAVVTEPGAEDAFGNAFETDADGNPLPWIANSADLCLRVELRCAENAACLTPVTAGLSSLIVPLSAFEVTGRDAATYTAVSAIRTTIANLKKVITAIAAYKPSSVTPTATAGTAVHRLPDTATNYGNLVLIGVAMMIFAGFSVFGIRRLALRAK